MASVAEKFRGERGDTSSAMITFVVLGATGARNALDLTETYIAANYASSTYDSLPLADISVIEISSVTGHYETTATFSSEDRQEPETSDIEYSFDLALDTRKVYTSLDTDASYQATGEAHKPTNNRINVQPDGEVEGADVRIPTASFQLTWFAPDTSVTASYKQTVSETVGKINDDTFYGHAAGEVMFVGASGSKRSRDDWQLTFRFEVSPNKTDVVIGESPNQITVSTVNGWQLLWVDYKAIPDTDANGKDIINHVPREAYVENIYEEADFSTLGIGTS
jgi:hypothetical protein